MSRTEAMPSRDTRALRRSWRPWLPLVVVLALAFGVGSFGSRPPATNEDRLFEIAKSVGCPVCNGETVAESNVEISKNIRVDIANRIKTGQSDDQIIAYLGTQYGASQLTPTSTGVASLVWGLPVVAFVVSLAGLALAFRRWQEPADHRATADDRALVDRALAGRVGGTSGAGATSPVPDATGNRKDPDGPDTDR